MGYANIKGTHFYRHVTFIPMCSDEPLEVGERCHNCGRKLVSDENLRKLKVPYNLVQFEGETYFLVHRYRNPDGTMRENVP